MSNRFKLSFNYACSFVIKSRGILNITIFNVENVDFILDPLNCSTIKCMHLYFSRCIRVVLLFYFHGKHLRSCRDG